MGAFSTGTFLRNPNERQTRTQALLQLAAQNACELSLAPAWVGRKKGWPECRPVLVTLAYRRNPRVSMRLR